MSEIGDVFDGCEHYGLWSTELEHLKRRRKTPVSTNCGSRSVCISTVIGSHSLHHTHVVDSVNFAPTAPRLQRSDPDFHAPARAPFPPLLLRCTSGRDAAEWVPSAAKCRRGHRSTGTDIP